MSNCPHCSQTFTDINRTRTLCNLLNISKWVKATFDPPTFEKILAAVNIDRLNADNRFVDTVDWYQQGITPVLLRPCPSLYLITKWNSFLMA